MALVVSEKLASLHELQTVYGYQDLVAMSEIVMVDRYNEWCAWNSDDK